MLRGGVGDRIHEDFRRDTIAATTNSRREDVIATARMEGTPEAPSETLRLTGIVNEIRLYQTRAVLAAPGGDKP